QFMMVIENRSLTVSLAKSRDQLADSEIRYRSVVETIDDIVFRIDSSGRIVFLNGAWEKITGYRVSESINHSIIYYFAKTSREQAQKRLFATSDHDGIIQPVQLVTVNGGIKLVEVMATAVDHIDPPGFIGSMKDVTLRNRLESELRVA